MSLALMTSDQLRLDTLQFFLLAGRLPTSLMLDFIGQTGEPRELSASACLMFAGMGLHWPLPCLARGFDHWFRVEKDAPQ